MLFLTDLLNSLSSNNLLNHSSIHQFSFTSSYEDFISSSKNNISSFLLLVSSSFILQLKKTNFKKKNIFIKKAAVKYKTSKIINKKTIVKLLKKASVSKENISKSISCLKSICKNINTEEDYKTVTLNIYSLLLLIS